MYRVAETPGQFARQLGIKPGSAVEAWNAPPEFLGALRGGIPPDTHISEGDTPTTSLPTIVIFWPRNMHDLAKGITAKLKDGSSPLAAVWVVIPKKPVAIIRHSDLFFQDVLDCLLPTGLVDNKTLTFSDDEYGLRFVPRRSPKAAVSSRAKP